MNTVQGFCDFNIPVECNPQTTLKDVVIKAVKSGYSAIAINTILDEEVLKPAKKKQKGKNEQPVAAETKKDIPPPPSLSFTEEELSSFKVHGKCIKILQRLTVILSEPGNTTKLVQSPHTKKYDLLAVCPVTSAAFQHIVANLDFDIITYDPQLVKDSIRFNRRQYRQAVDRGIYFEIPYAYMFRDSNSRKKLIQMTHWYHSIGKSRNIVMSSGATSPQEIRGPYDIANMGLLFGLSEGESRASLNLSGRSIALHAITRKTGKCVSYVTETEKLKPIDQWKIRELKNAEESFVEPENHDDEPEPKKARTDDEPLT